MKTNKYWKKRFEQLEESLHKNAIDVYNEIQKNFELAQKEIELEIASWYQRFANNNSISIDEAKKWLNANELKEFKWSVEEYIKYGKENAINQKWIKELENASAKFHISRLETLKINTRQSLEALYNKENKLVNTMSENTYSNGYYRTCFELQKGFNIGFDIGTINNSQLQKIISKPWTSDGKNFSDRIWQSKNQLIEDLHNELTRTCLLGKAPDDAIKNIANKFKVSKRQAGRLVMTEQAYFSSLSQKEAFKDLDVEQFEIVATLDSRTSEICQDMDGKVFDMANYEVGVTAPPFHPYCRSVTVPYFDDEFNLGKRAARNENGKTYYVPSNMTYKEWKEKYVADDHIITNNKKNYTREYVQNKRKASFKEDIKIKKNENNIVNYTDEEKNAINKYLSPYSITLNEKLRNNKTLDEIDKNIISNLDSALSKMPNYTETRIVRSMIVDNQEEFLKQIDDEGIFSTNQYLSFSTKENYHDNPNIKIYIETPKNVKDLRNLNTIGEKEVLYERNKKFKTLKKVKKDGIIYLLWEEIK